MHITDVKLISAIRIEYVENDMGSKYKIFSNLYHSFVFGGAQRR